MGNKNEEDFDFGEFTEIDPEELEDDYDGELPSIYVDPPENSAPEGFDGKQDDDA